MKKILSFTILVFFLLSCNSPKRIALTDLSKEDYRYILDFQSRVAQEKMRILRSNYSAGSVGVFFIDAVGNSLNDPHQQDERTQMPKFFRKIRITNKGKGTLYADLITHQVIDQDHTCSVKNIQLPKRESIFLLVMYNQSYALNWNYSGAEKKSYNFIPSGEKVLKVSELGVNPTVIIY